jgi:hypothetical protein
MYMKKIKPNTLLLAIVCLFFVVKLNAQVYTKANSNGTTAIKIVDPDGVKSWAAFDEVKTDKKIDEEINLPCPKPEYIKDPTAKLSSNKKYWLLYRDCSTSSPTGEKKTFKIEFHKGSNVDQWVQMDEMDIPDPKKGNFIYYGIGGLLVLIILYFIFRRKSRQ